MFRISNFIKIVIIDTSFTYDFTVDKVNVVINRFLMQNHYSSTPTRNNIQIIDKGALEFPTKSQVILHPSLHTLYQSANKKGGPLKMDQHTGYRVVGVE